MITPCSCCSRIHVGRLPGPAVALWGSRNGGVECLCKACLDIWLDNADDDPFMEPACLAMWPSGKPLTCGNVEQASDLRFFPAGAPPDTHALMSSLSPHVLEHL